jgi:DNA-binding winged helix-turn-helix (wHTH) protein
VYQRFARDRRRPIGRGRFASAVSFGFQGFVVDADACRLLCNGEEVALEPRAFDLLLYLVKHRDRVVSKQELLEQVWGARILSEGVLSNTVAKLRRALGQSPAQDQPIETVHKRGYRFRAELHDAAVASTAPVHRWPREATDADPFVGREAVLQALVQRLDQGYRGSENLVVLCGEAGIGKTRTTRELSSRARQRGVSVWVGATYEGGGAPPYWPWIQILRAAHEEVSDALWQAFMPPGAWAIAQLVPELQLQAPATALVEPQLARFQLFEEVTRFLKRACVDRPLLLIIDDLHWADLGTIELFGSVARALQEQPVMLLATLRTGEPPSHHDERSPMELLGRVATPISLQGLSAQEVSELTVAVTGKKTIDPALVRALHHRTQGNALFVRQALDLIALRGDWSFVEEALPPMDLPPAIRHVIRRRLAALAEGTRGALEAAAVVGNTFETPVLATVLEVTAERVLEDLEPAVQMGVIQQKGGQPDVFTFAHVLAKDSLYEELGMRKRGELHGRIAHALSQRYGGARSRYLGEIAGHYLQALPFDLERTIDACRSAAAAAQEASGFEAAAQLLERAIVRLDAEGGKATTRFRLLLELGEDHFYAGAIASAWQAFRAAADTVGPSGPIELLAEVAPRLVDCLELGVGDARRARAVVEQALAGLADDATAPRASLLAQRAELALELGIDQRFALLDQAAALAERSGAAEAILEVAHSRAILRDPTRLRQNAEAAAHFLDLAERYPDAAAGMRYRSLRRFGAHLTRYLSALTACDILGGEAALQQCQHIADASHVRAARFAVDLMQAGRALAHGRLSDVEGIIDSLSRRAGDEESLFDVVKGASHRAGDEQARFETAAWASIAMSLLRARGNLDVLSGLRFDEDLITDLAASRHGLYLAIGSAELYALTGRLERARAILAQIPQSALARMPAQYGDLGALCSLVEICRAEDDLEGAEQLYDQLSPYAALNAVYPTFEYRGSVAHFLGILAHMLGRRSEATAHFQQALEINGKLIMPLQVALSERELRD